MKFIQPVFLLALTAVLGGCTATITPRGNVYTGFLVPSAVVVERRPPVTLVPTPRHLAHQPRGPMVAGRHSGFNPKPGTGPKGPAHFR